ncbi:outer membrane autotransporter barrel domain protein [Escherichia coli]|uniref:Outer membrane autotransporter barrel domain protein n=1 Tax=Escherichia coli TaxID=562 RepID=A0A377BI02_ECOLX|nr:outer membrane autotransporter barrel domain protein [Escherichia coli]
MDASCRRARAFKAGDGQLNTQANRYVLQLGGDLAQWSSNAQDRWHLGVMTGYANQHSNTQSNRVVINRMGASAVTALGCTRPGIRTMRIRPALMLTAGRCKLVDNSVSSDNRSADDYDSRGVTASVEGGYTFEAGTFSAAKGR